MNKKRTMRLAKKILQNENIIEGQKGLGKSVQTAKAEIEDIIGCLSMKEFLELDDYIMNHKKI